MNRPADWHREETLHDGTRIRLRFVRPDDGPRIRAAFRTLAPRSTYTRFFAYKPNLSDEELRHVTGIDPARDIVLLATIGPEETVIGGASAYVLPGSGERDAHAEVAFTVEEAYQGKGLASLLLHHLGELGRARHWQALEAEVLACNTPMLRVFAESGLPMTSHRNEDTVHVTLELRNGEKPA